MRFVSAVHANPSKDFAAGFTTALQVLSAEASAHARRTAVAAIFSRERVVTAQRRAADLAQSARHNHWVHSTDPIQP